MPLLITNNVGEQWKEVKIFSDLGAIRDIVDQNNTKVLVDNAGRISELNASMKWKAKDGIENTKSAEIGISKIGIYQISGLWDVSLRNNESGNGGRLTETQKKLIWSLLNAVNEFI